MIRPAGTAAMVTALLCGGGPRNDAFYDHSTPAGAGSPPYEVSFAGCLCTPHAPLGMKAVLTVAQ